MSTTKSLRKAVFINSAQIPYQEVSLDGNVHFIGTQGTGKSTVQRALLFFYTAALRSSKLGLSSSQKSFSEYYFPYENAYLVYEIGCMVNKDGNETEAPEESFIVIVFKRASGLRFLFARTGFDREFFLADDGVTVLLPQDMQRQLSSAKCYTSPVIDSAASYRDILYGKNRQHTAFSLFRSNAYENIPRTIEKVFLNAGLNSDAIKHTIIDSAILNDVSEFELDSHNKQLRDFNEIRKQVEVFHNHKSQVSGFLNRYQKVLERRDLLQQLAIRVFHAVHGTKQQIAEHLEQVANIDEQTAETEQSLDYEYREYQQERDVLKQQIGVLENNISKGKKLFKKYEEANITALLKEHQQEDSYQVKKEGLEQQRLTLTDGARSIEERYNMERKQVQQQFEAQRLLIETKKQEINRNALEEEGSSRKYYDTQRDGIEQQYSAYLEQQKSKLEEVSTALQQARQLEYEAQHASSLKKELEEAQERRKTLDRKAEMLKVAISNGEGQIQLDRTSYEILEREEQQEIAQLKQEHLPTIQQLTKTTEKLEEKVDKLGDTLYGFLQEHIPQWENGIGKVVDERLLFLPANEVSYDKSQPDSLLGLSLPVDKLPSLHGPKDYIAELEYYRQQKEQALATYTSAGEALKKRYEGKKRYATEQSRKLKKELEQKQYELQQALRKIQSCDQEIEAIEAHAAEKRKENIAKATAKAQECKSLYQQAQQEEAEVKAQREAALLEARQAYESRLEGLRSRLSIELREQEQLLKEQKEAEVQALNELRAQEYKELESNQLDSKRIARIDQELEVINQKLKAINKNRNTVVAYQKEYPEFIGNIPENEQAVAAYNEQLQKLDTQHHQKSSSRKKQLKQLSEQKTQLESTASHWKIQLQNFEDSIAPSKIWEAYKPFFPKEPSPSSERQIASLCQQLMNEYYSLQTEEGAVFDACTKYVGYLPEDNVFGFKTTPETKTEKEELLHTIRQYLKENRILQLEKELGHKFSLMLKRINKDYELLLTQQQTVNQLISKINRSFKQGNFVGAVKALEMKTEPSRSRLIQELEQINEFVASYGQEIGESGLFTNADKQQFANKKAIELLDRFYDAMQSSKLSIVKLADTFELQFRIRENENDTGWLENVRSVGSNGTDVLVKAMVYITLLQVFKEQVANIKTNKQQQIDIWLHCIIDEVGILHDSNIQGLANFANERGIWLINGSPNANDAASYRHIYQFRKRAGDKTQIIRLLSKQNHPSHAG